MMGERSTNRFNELELDIPLLTICFLDFSRINVTLAGKTPRSNKNILFRYYIEIPTFNF